MTAQYKIINNCVADLSKYYGIPPHENDPILNNPSALIRIHDSYTDIVRGHAFKRIIKLHDEWLEIRSKFIGVHKLQSHGGLFK